MANVKVILNREVLGLGGSGDVVTVAAGYARNYLVPRNLAQPWTKGAQKQIDALVRAARRREIANVEEARAMRDAIAAAGKVTIAKRAGKEGRLFGSVSAVEIAEAVAAQLGQKVDYRKVHVSAPIKSVGKFQVKINLHEDVSVNLDVIVEGAKA